MIPLSRYRSRWDFHFHSYVLTIYVCLYRILELIVFYSLVRRGYMRKVSVQLIPRYFPCDCSTDSISCSERKNRKKKRLKQESKSRKEDKTLLSSPIHLAHHCSAVAPLSLCCRTAIATLSLCCRSAVASLSHRYRTDIAPLSLRCCRSWCRYAVAPLLHRYCATVAFLLSLLLSLGSCTAIAPLSRHTV